MIKLIIAIVLLLVAGLFCLDHYCPDILKNFIERYKSFITCLAIIGTLGLIASFYITFYQQQKSCDARISNLASEIAVNISICKNELIEHYRKHQDLEAIPVPESRFHITIIEKALASGDITNKKSNLLLWNSYRQMTVVNSLLDQALLIRHTEHIGDPSDTILISGRRAKVNSLVKATTEMVENIVIQLEEANDVLKKGA
jgi:hypothetical protein